MASLGYQFLALAAVVAVAGMFLARAADAIAAATGLGRLLVGSVLLAAATSLPELTIDIAAVRAGMPDLATGDLMGSSLMNLLILAGIDLSRRHGRGMLSREAASHALSATLSIALTAIAGLAILTAARLPGVTVFGIGSWSWAILAAYVLGARMLFIDQRISARLVVADRGGEPPPTASPPARAAAVFAGATVAILLAGPRLAHVAGELAERSGLGGTFVGTTLVALTTSLPELVSSVAAVRIGAIDLAIGNTFGSNAFNMFLFVPLDAVHPGSLFAAVSPAHAATAFAVIVATTVAVLGQLYHVERRVPVFEPDAILVVILVGAAFVLVYHLS